MRESGQTLLIVVLVMVVVLTVGLSVVLRSVTNLRIAVEEDNSARAFSAAESGIEQALKTGVSFTEGQSIDPGDLNNVNTKIKSVTVTAVNGKEFLVNSGNTIEKDDPTDIWLVEHNTDGTLNFSSGWQLLASDAKLTVYWGSSSVGCDSAALEIVVISGTSTAPEMKRYAYDPCEERRISNKFSAPTKSEFVEVKSKYFYYFSEIPIASSSKGFLVRINPIYKKTTLAVRGCPIDKAITDPSCNTLPSQGKLIESIGSSGNSLRKVTFFQGYTKVPAEFFPYVSFSTQ